MPQLFFDPQRHLRPWRWDLHHTKNRGTAKKGRDSDLGFQPMGKLMRLMSPIGFFVKRDLDRFGVSMVETGGPFLMMSSDMTNHHHPGGSNMACSTILIWLVVWNMAFIFPFSWACRHPAKIKKELYVAMHKIYGSKDRTVKKSLFQEGFTFHDCSIFLGITGELFGGIVRSVVRGHNSLERFDKKSSYYCR